MHARWMSTCALTLSFALLAACGGGGGPGVTQPPPDNETGSEPAAQIYVDSSVGGAPGTFQFYGQGADPDCTALSYAWDFDGNGTTDSVLQSPSFAYATPGERDVTLTVTDGAGDTATATCVVSARDAPASSAPGVQIRCHALLGEESMETLLIAEAVDLDAGSIADYNWDFDGNGSVDLTTAARSVVRTLAGPGQVTVSCRVDSTDGGSNTATLTVFLCEDGSMPELGPGLQVEHDDFGPGGFTVGATAGFFAVGSDVDGGALSTIGWDTNDDSVFSDKTGRVITSLPWPGPGDSPYRVRARATDDDGKTSLALETVSITALPGIGRWPSARARAMTVLGSTGTPIQFLGDAADPDGDIAATEWDLDNDGDFDDGTTLRPTFTYTERGVYTPTLRVKDANGNESFAYMTLVVECCPDGGGSPPPGGYWWFDCADKTIGHGASVFCPLGPPAVLIPPALGPTQAGIANCNPTIAIGGDPGCTQIDLFDHDGTPVPPFKNPPPAIVAALGFFIDSTAVDGPSRTVSYTISIRLREPGVRVQILKCDVHVVHDSVACNLPILNDQNPNFLTELQVGIGSGALNNPLIQHMAPITGIEFVNDQQTPPWLSSMTFPGATMPPGWQVQQTPQGLFFDIGDPLTANPIVPGQAFADGPFQFTFQTDGSQPQMGEVRFYDVGGNIVAREPAPHGP